MQAKVHRAAVLYDLCHNVTTPHYNIVRSLGLGCVAVAGAVGRLVRVGGGDHFSSETSAMYIPALPSPE